MYLEYTLTDPATCHGDMYVYTIYIQIALCVYIEILLIYNA